NKRCDKSWQVGVNDYRLVVYADYAGNHRANETLLGLEGEVHGIVGPALGGFFNNDAAGKLAAHQVVKKGVDLVNCFFFANVMASLDVHSWLDGVGLDSVA